MPPAAAKVELQDARIERLYIHDDNLGPNLRFDIIEDSGRVVLKRSKPKATTHKWKDVSDQSYPDFVPESLVTAVHDGVRTSPDELHRRGLEGAGKLRDALALLGKNVGVTLSTRFPRCRSTTETLGGEFWRTTRRWRAYDWACTRRSSP